MAQLLDAPAPSLPGRATPAPPAPAAPVVRIQLLNSFRCEYDGQHLRLPHSTARVLALLSLHSRPVERTRLYGMLWPQHGAEHASGSLRTAIWRLRRSCPGLLTVDQHALGLRPGLSVDYQDLVHRVEQVRSSQVTDVPPTAAETLTADEELLPGWYDDWVILHRERLRELRLEALRTTVRTLFARNQLVKALDLALQALAAEPLDEDAHALVVRIHLSQGNAAEAVRHYRLYEDLLRSELDLAPSPALRQLVRPRATPHEGPRSA